MMVKATFQMHIYEREWEIYQQVEGCPTGLRPSGPISRLFMDNWVRYLRRIEAEIKELQRINPIMFCQMDIKLLKKYVDGVLFGQSKEDSEVSVLQETNGKQMPKPSEIWNPRRRLWKSEFEGSGKINRD